MLNTQAYSRHSDIVSVCLCVTLHPGKTVQLLKTSACKWFVVDLHCFSLLETNVCVVISSPHNDSLSYFDFNFGFVYAYVCCVSQHNPPTSFILATKAFYLRRGKGVNAVFVMNALLPLYLFLNIIT